MIGLLLGLIISGLVIGALGRLAIPGPNPMSIPKTILVGIGGSFLGAVVGLLLFRRDARSHGAVLLLLEIAGAALIVYLLQRREHTA